MRYLRNCTFALCLLSMSSQLVSQSSPLESCLPRAHTWRWWSNLAYPNDDTTGWGRHPETYSYIIDNQLNTFVDTDLDIGRGPRGEGELRFINLSNLGSRAPYAWARVWSYNKECSSVRGNNHWFDNGGCVQPDYPATRALITFNHDRTATNSIGFNIIIALHEVGHVFGLAHLPSHCPSFMAAGAGVGKPTELTPFEVAWINARY